MYCSNCGKELRENAKFCSFCGTTVITEQAVDNVANEKPDNTEEVITVAEEISAEETVTDENAEHSEEAVQEACEEADETESEDKLAEFAEKFQEEGGLFVVKNEPAPQNSSPVISEEKKKIPWVKITVAVVCAAAIGVSAYIIPTTVLPAIKYSNAQKLYESGDYEGAVTAFEALGDYKESAEYILRCHYSEAEKLFKDGRYPEAADAFTSLEGYSDSDSRAAECMVAIAEGYIADGDYDAAMSVYAAAGKADLAEQTALKKIEALAEMGEYFKAAEIAENYCSEDIVLEYRYQGALAAKADGDYKTAADNFYKLGKYSDSEELAKDCTFSFYMSEYSRNGSSEEIVRGFYFLGDFRNSQNMFVNTSYEYGLTCKANGDYASAVAMFKNCGTYKSAINELYNSRYNLGKTLLDTDPASARSVFALLSTYSDSAEQKKIASQRLPDSHEDWYADGFTSVGNYYTTFFRTTDTLLITCTAGTDTISGPITLTLTLRDSSGNEVSADCENVRNSGSFNGSFSLASAASGDAEIIIARKDNGAVLRTIDINIVK